MAEFRLSRQASDDLRNILNYTITTWSRVQAEKYHAQLMFACRTIAHNPALGREYVEIDNGLYGFRSGGHIVFYRITAPGQILVERILHGRMDLPNRLGRH